VSFGLYRRLFGQLVRVALATTAIPLVINTYVTAAGGFTSHLWIGAANLVLAIVLNSIATAATVFIVSESYLGRTLSAGDAFHRAMPFVGRIIWLGLLSGLVIGLGFILFFVPGFIFMAGLILAIPALVLENHASGLEAMARAWSLSRGQRWKILGVVITVGLIVYLPVIAVGGILPAFVDPAGLAGMGEVSGTALVLTAVAGVLQVLIFPLFYCALTVTYYDLRVRKEGFDLEILAARLQPA
jgi:hypothetical protein